MFQSGRQGAEEANQTCRKLERGLSLSAGRGLFLFLWEGPHRGRGPPCSGDPSASKQLCDQNDEGDDQEQVNQATAHAADEPQQPQDEDYRQQCPEHLLSSVRPAGRQLLISCANQVMGSTEQGAVEPGVELR